MTEIEEIKQKLDIVDVVGQYVSLKKSGKNYKGLCPFHGEKSPSFMVSQDLQIYKCFGCNEGGDIFSFVEKMEGYDFRQALENLAGRAGVKLKDYSHNEKVDGNKSVLWEINEISKKFYHYILTKHVTGKTALDYLTNKRKLNLKTIDDWEIGYAPNSWTSLVDFLIKRGYEEKDLLKAGVAVPDKFESRLNDKFRGRVVFPLTGIDSKVLGFGGRTITNREPKYLNTQETSIFHKESFLFGLNKTRMEIKNQGAVVVEGYMDAISVYQEGVANVVATCGTALTMPHLKIISRYSSDIIFCFDSDTAGINATLRAIEMSSTLDLNPKVVIIPEGYKDIDDVAKIGGNKVKQVIKEALPAYDYIIKIAESKHDMRSPIGKKKILEEVCYYLYRSPNFVTKEHYAQILGEKLEVSPDSIIKYLNESGSGNTQSETSNVTINNAKSPQEYLVALVLSQNTLDKYKEILENLEPDDLEDGNLSSIYAKLLNFIKEGEGFSVKTFTDGLIDQELVKARELSLWDIGELSVNNEKFIEELKETVKRVLRESHKRRMSETTYKIREAERVGDSDKVEQLMKEFNKLSEILHHD